MILTIEFVIIGIVCIGGGENIGGKGGLRKHCELYEICVAATKPFESELSVLKLFILL